MGGVFAKKLSPEEQEQLQKRLRVREEVVTTEQSYWNSLDNCVKVIIHSPFFTDISLSQFHLLVARYNSSA